MRMVIFALIVTATLHLMGIQAADDCGELLSGTIKGRKEYENCNIPSGTTLTIESYSNVKFINLTAVGATINIDPLNVVSHLHGGNLTAMAGNIFVVGFTGQVRNVTLYAKGVYARGASGSAFAVCADDVQGTSIMLEDCDIEVGVSSGDLRGVGSIMPSKSNPVEFKIDDVALMALRSMLVVRGRHAVAAMGVAKWRGSGNIVGTLTRVTIRVVGSNVQVFASTSIGNAGISAAAGSSVSLILANVTIVVHGSNVTTSGSWMVASVGIAAHGSGATVTSTNGTMAAHGSSVTSRGSDHSVTSLGILLWCRYHNSCGTLTARDTLITAQLSHITATGPNAGIVAMGLGSFGLQTTSFPTVAATNVSLIACGSTVVSSEVAFDVVARFDRPSSRFLQHRPASVANWSVTIIDSTVTTVYAAPHGNCLMALPNATHNGTAPSMIRESVLNCSGLPATEPMAPGMLFTSNVTDRDDNGVAFIGANNTTGGPFDECPIPHHQQQRQPTPTQQPTPSLTTSESTYNALSHPPSRTHSSSPAPQPPKDATLEPTNAEEHTESASAVEQQTVTVTVISSVTLSTVASAGGGGGGSGDVQAMLVVAGLRCANPGAQQAAEGARRALMPLEGLFGPPNASGTVGALIVVLALLVLQLAIAAIKLRIARGKDSAATLMEQLAVLRCPMVPLRVFGLLHQGVALQSMELLWGNAAADVTPIDRAIAALGLFTATMVPLAAAAVSMHVADGGSELLYSAYERVWQRNGTPALLRLLVVPRGLWEATARGAVCMTAAAGANGPKAIKWGLLVFAQAIGISLLATLDGSIGCDTQIVALTVVFALAAVLPLSLRSQRVQWRTSSGLLLGLLNAVVTLSFHSTLRSTLGGHAVQLVVFMGVLSTLASIGNVVVWLAERSWRTKELALRDEEEKGTQMLVLAQDTDAASGEPKHRQQRREDGAAAISNPLVSN